MNGEDYLKRISQYIKTPTDEIKEQLNDFLSRCSYVSGQYDKDESFQDLRAHLEDLEHGRSNNHRLFYMALPPSVFKTVSDHLKKNCYPERGIARLIVRAMRRGV
jgi:glucose-6-phosphate 1-dehydrogenase